MIIEKPVKVRVYDELKVSHTVKNSPVFRQEWYIRDSSGRFGTVRDDSGKFGVLGSKQSEIREGRKFLNMSKITVPYLDSLGLFLTV